MKSTVRVLAFIALMSSFSQAGKAQATKHVTEKNLSFTYDYWVQTSNRNYLQGPYREYYGDLILVDGNYHENAMDGLWKYYIDGKLYLSMTFKNGFQHGVTTIYRDGHKYKEINYDKDVISGKYTYFRESGEVRSEYSYANGKEEGPAKTYYKGGQLSGDLNYKDGDLHGTIRYYFSNGVLINQRTYHEGKLKSVDSCHTFDGKSDYRYRMADGTGSLLVFTDDGKVARIENYKNYKLNGDYKSFHYNGRIKERKSYLDGKIHGFYARFDSTGGYIDTGYTEHGIMIGEWHRFCNGQKTSKLYTLEDSTKFSMYSCGRPEATYTAVESMPSFYGGMPVLYKHIAKEVKYPDQDKKDGNQGTVYVQFIVETTGDVTGIEVFKSIGDVSKEMEQSSVETIEALPRWKPGFQAGVPVRVRYTIPIAFKLR